MAFGPAYDDAHSLQKLPARLAHYFRQYWWTRFARPVLRPVIRVSKWWHGHAK